MALILNIDTSHETACVSLAADNNVINAAMIETQKDHASWIHESIRKLFVGTGYTVKNLGAIGLSNGPGSYTGLRIALSTAKGLCYALKIPLITVGSLQVMAFNAVQALAQVDSHDAEPAIEDLLFCPMIEARRMEVFTAVYDVRLNEVVKPQACVLSPSTFDELLKRQKILFLGNGSTKFRAVCQHVDNAIFKSFPLNPSALALITYRNFIGNNFAALAYTEPFYLKKAFIAKKPGE